MTKNTKQSFSDKWANNSELAFSQTCDETSSIFKWILNRNGFSDSKELKRFLDSKNRILDAGCGNGRVTALLRNFSSDIKTEIVGIDVVSAEIAKKNLSDLNNIKIFSKDILQNLDDLGRFDFIYCQEVLHHTSSPEKAFSNLCGLLADGGEIAIYVYKQKAPIREFVDDFIRDKISNLPYDDAVKVCNQITSLGKTLSELDITLNVPAVDVLEIDEGELNLQRFFYHFFMKCFWNPEMSFHENAIINYDWYHPQDCSRHTFDEVKQWFANEELFIQHEYVDHYGITIRGKAVNR